MNALRAMSYGGGRPSWAQPLIAASSPLRSTSRHFLGGSWMVNLAVGGWGLRAGVLAGWRFPFIGACDGSSFASAKVRPRPFMAETSCAVWVSRTRPLVGCLVRAGWTRAVTWPWSRNTSAPWGASWHPCASLRWATTAYGCHRWAVWDARRRPVMFCVLRAGSTGLSCVAAWWLPEESSAPPQSEQGGPWHACPVVCCLWLPWTGSA